MPKNFDENKINRYLDGELNEDERKLLENQLEGSEEGVEHLHRLLQVISLMKELPKHKPPIDLVAAVREKRQEEENQKPFSPESTFAGTLMRIGALAAAIALVFVFVYRSGVNNQAGLPSRIDVSSKEKVSDNTSAANAVRKASTHHDILNQEYSANINQKIDGLDISISRALDDCIELNLTNISEQRAYIKKVEADLNIEFEYKPGYGKAVYLIKDLSPDVLRQLVSALLKIDSELKLSNSLGSYTKEKERFIVDISSSSPNSVYVVLNN